MIRKIYNWIKEKIVWLLIGGTVIASVGLVTNIPATVELPPNVQAVHALQENYFRQNGKYLQVLPGNRLPHDETGSVKGRLGQDIDAGYRIDVYEAPDGEQGYSITWKDDDGYHVDSFGSQKSDRDRFIPKIATSTSSVFSGWFASLFTQIAHGAVVQTHTADMDGSTEYFSITDGAQTGLDLTSDFTVEAWVNLDGTNENNVITKNTGAGNQRGYTISFIPTSSLMRIGMSVDGSAFVESDVTVTIGTGSWLHMAWVYDASAGTWEAYLDGASEGTGTGLPTSINDNTSEVAVGSSAGGGGGHLDGRLDDVRVWNDIRTTSEIDTNKDNCFLSTSEAGLVSWWLLNNDETDEHTNGNDLTNNNTVPFQTASLPYACGDPPSTEDYNNSQIW